MKTREVARVPVAARGRQLHLRTNPAPAVCPAQAEEAMLSKLHASSPQVSTRIRTEDSAVLSHKGGHPVNRRFPAGAATDPQSAFAPADDPTAQPYWQSVENQTPEISTPLVFTDPGSILPQEPALEAALQEAANQLASDLTARGHAPDTPEYSEHWNRTVDLSNQHLRQRFGGQVWTAHHIQAHHLRTATAEGD